VSGAVHKEILEALLVLRSLCMGHSFTSGFKSR
jgi:hypothetical protein